MLFCSFGGPRVLNMVTEVITDIDDNKKRVIGSIHETQPNGTTPNYMIMLYGSHAHVQLLSTQAVFCEY